MYYMLLYVYLFIRAGTIHDLLNRVSIQNSNFQVTRELTIRQIC